jgi:exopolysaccharide biosynthesis polyprenyl glycosylphosphotransferase
MLRVFRHYLPARRALLVLSEFAILCLALALGTTVHLLSPSVSVMEQLVRSGMDLRTAWARSLASAVALSLLSLGALAFNELYEFRISGSRYDRASRFVTASGVSLLLAIGAATLARLWHLEYVLDFPGLTTSQLVQTLGGTLLVAFAVLYLWRNLFHFALRRFDFNERVLILGAGPQALSLAEEMGARMESGFEAVGLLTEGQLAGLEEGPRALEHASGREHGNGHSSGGSGARAAAALALKSPPRTSSEPAPAEVRQNDSCAQREISLGPGESLLELVHRLRVDVVCVALEDRRKSLPVEELLRCRLNGVPVKEREALYEHITGKIAVEALRPSYLIFNDGFDRSARGDSLKRVVDLALAALGLVLLMPAMLATAVAVRLDSPGSTLFAQQRVGLNGRPFTLLKFRSMRSDAERSTGPVWAQKDDPRITRAGRFMRKTRLDELPQLFNVLAGDMSLVGPRPERPMFVDELTLQIPYYNQRHIVKPGLTGWAQINYPYGNTVEDARQKLQYDLFYIKNRSLLFDLSILVTTVKTVVLRRGT